MNFIIQKCTPSDIEEIINIIQTVYEQMSEKSWFAADNADYIRQLLSPDTAANPERATTACAYRAVETESGQTAGIFITDLPGLSEENLGRDCGLPEAELTATAHMDTAVVLPQYRGHHLQRRLMTHAEWKLARQGIRHLCCTIHPDNRYSLESALSLGYRIAVTKEKYGGYLRCVLIKDLQEERTPL